MKGAKMKRGKFLTELDSQRFVRDKKVWVRLLSDLVYVDSKRKKHVIPTDFESDGASIPQFAWSIVGHPFGLYLESAIVHDWLYRYLKKNGMKRGYADWVLLDGMKTQKISFWKRHVMHKTVRAFGGIHKFFTNEKIP